MGTVMKVRLDQEEGRVRMGPVESWRTAPLLKRAYSEQSPRSEGHAMQMSRTADAEVLGWLQVALSRTYKEGARLL